MGRGRELKFRTPVVCQDGHRMYCYWQIKPSRSLIVRVLHDGIPPELRCPCVGPQWDRNGPDEQFTGLKDIDGKEIYEGDILQDREDGTIRGSVTVTFYHGYRFMLGKDQLCRADAKYGSVIGSAYLTPELMEKEKPNA